VIRFHQFTGLLFVAASLCLTESVVADPLTVNFSNIPGSSITFVSTGDGATFSFPGQSGNDFSVSRDANFTSGDLTGLLGNITGVFGYKTADIVDLGGGVLMAPVTPVSTGNEFVIHDGSGADFTADLAWTMLMTIAPGGGLDLSATINLTNFQYSGTLAPLQELAQSPSGSVTAAFTFQPIALDLNQLATQCGGAGCSTSFSGTMAASPSPSVPEEPQPYGFLLGLVGLAGFHRRLLKA